MKLQKKWLSLFMVAALLASTVSGYAEVTTTATTSAGTTTLAGTTTTPATTSLTATTSAAINLSEVAIGNTYEGFKLVKKQWSEEAASTVYQLEHVKTGGKVIYFENNDRHKAFDVVFKTPVHDNTGVNHVLEHSVLSGSAKYPSKSPFMTMAQTSVNTYANALTYTDKTAYPFSSQNDKDFDNLMNVYMDAVFAPKIVQDEKLFQREGWGYEIDAKTGKIGYKGVVFSEMKGSMSNPGSILYDAYKKNLFPQTKFAFNSGGNPENIVTLTHKQLADTYKKYYNPSNALIYLYGKMNIQEKLHFIDQSYYSQYDKQTVDTSYGTQKPFDKPRYPVANYHVDPGTDLKGKTMISVGYGLQPMPKKDLFAMSLLVSLMSNLEVSPMKKAFKTSGIGQSFSGSMSLESQALSVSFMTPDTDAKQKAAFEKLIQSQLEVIVKNGFDKELIKSSLDSVDLGNRLTKLNANKGNSLRDVLEIGHVTYNNPLYFLDSDALIEEIKKSALNDRYFETLIEKYLLKNNHKIVLSLEPKVDFNKAADQRLNAKLGAFQKSMSPNALLAFKKNNATFENWKIAPDTAENLAKLPTLSLKDIQYSVQSGQYATKVVSSIPVNEHEGTTNKTVSLSYYFDVDSLTAEELKDLPLYVSTFGTMGTQKKDMATLTNAILSNTGGIGVNSKLVLGSDNFTIKDQKVVMTGICLESKLADTMALMNEMATTHVYNDLSVLKNSVEQNISGYEYYYMNDGDNVAWEKLNKGLTPKGQLEAEENQAASAYYKNLAKNWEKESPKLLARFESIQKKVMNANGLMISVVAEKTAMPAVEANVDVLVKGLAKDKFPENTTTFKASSNKLGITMPSQVQYVYKGFNTHQTGGKVDGSTFVFAQLMNNEYLYPTIRVKGGAYGGSMFASKNGNVVFSSYRDPGLATTVTAIDKSVDFLKTLNLSQEQLNPYIISVLGGFDAPVTVFDLAGADDSRYLSGTTLAAEEALMKSIAETKPADLKAFIDLIETGLKSASVIVTGSDAEIQKNKGLFDSVKKSVE